MMPRPRIKVLDKTFHILDLFDERGKKLSAKEIVDTLNINKSTASRILSILEGKDYLERDPKSLKYRLGLKLYFLGSLVEGIGEMQQLARPFLQELVHQCEETVHLVIFSHGEALYVDKIEGKRALRMVSRVGMSLPAHCSGVGKVLLSYLDTEALHAIIAAKGLSRFTNNTITKMNTLKTELSKIRQQGYAIDNEEIEVGLKCVAAPVSDVNDHIIAAISVAGPKDRLTDLELRRLIPLVRTSAEKISGAFKKKKLDGRILLQ